MHLFFHNTYIIIPNSYRLLLLLFVAVVFYFVIVVIQFMVGYVFILEINAHLNVSLIKVKIFRDWTRYIRLHYQCGNWLNCTLHVKLS